MLAQHASTLCDVVVRCLHTPRSATVPAGLPPDAGRRTCLEKGQPAFEMYFFITILIIDIFVGFRPSKIQMALCLKTRNFNFGDPTTGRTPSSREAAVD